MIPPTSRSAAALTWLAADPSRVPLHAARLFGLHHSVMYRALAAHGRGHCPACGQVLPRPRSAVAAAVTAPRAPSAATSARRRDAAAVALRRAARLLAAGLCSDDDYLAALRAVPE